MILRRSSPTSSRGNETRLHFQLEYTIPSPWHPQPGSPSQCLVMSLLRLFRNREKIARSVHCFLGSQRFIPISRTLQKPGQTPKSSVPVLSAAKPWFSQGFSHFWPIALEFCSAHATRCMAPAALYFASRTPNRVVFRVARVAKTLGFCMARSGTDPHTWRW